MIEDKNKIMQYHGSYGTFIKMKQPYSFIDIDKFKAQLTTLMKGKSISKIEFRYEKAPEEIIRQNSGLISKKNGQYNKSYLYLDGENTLIVAPEVTGVQIYCDNCDQMFKECGINEIVLTNFSTEQTTSMKEMFADNGGGVIRFNEKFVVPHELWKTCIKRNDTNPCYHMFYGDNGNYVHLDYGDWYEGGFTDDGTFMKAAYLKSKTNIFEVPRTSSSYKTNTWGLYRSSMSDDELASYTLTDISADDDTYIVRFQDTNARDIYWHTEAVKIFLPENSTQLFGVADIGIYHWYKNESLDMSMFDTSRVTSMVGIFGCMANIKSIDLAGWNTDNVTNMRKMFLGCIDLVLLDISHFNTSNVTDMSYMFRACDFESLNLTSFDTSNVVYMNNMFDGPGSKIVSIDVSNFNTEKVIDMSYMFSYCGGLTSLDLSNFDVSKVIDMTCMFEKCESLKQLIVFNGSTSNVTNMKGMFSYCESLESIDLSGFNTSKVIDMSNMFYWCTSLKSLDLHTFDTRNVRNFASMFYYCRSLQQLDLSNFDTSNATSMFNMFCDCYSLVHLDVSNFDTSNVTNMSQIFDSCEALTSVDVSKWNTQNVSNMMYMFNRCGKLTSLDVSNFDTGNVTGFGYMFYGCSHIKELDVSHFDTSNAVGMYNMFSLCSSLEYLDVSSFNTENLVTTEEMFWGCSSLKSLDVSGFNTSKVTNMEDMFLGCHSLTSLNLDNFKTDKVASFAGMFSSCGFVNLSIRNFDFSSATDIGLMFAYNYDMENIDFPQDWKIDSTKLKSCYGVFSHCKKLTNISLTGFYFPSVNKFYTDGMFYQCESLTSLDVSNLDLSNATSIKEMFYGCSKLVSLKVPHFSSISQVTNMQGVFERCSSLTALDLSKWNTEKVTNMDFMFYGCGKLTSLNISSFNTSNVTSMYYMFSRAPIERLDISNFDTSNVSYFKYFADTAREIIYGKNFILPKKVWDYATNTTDSNYCWCMISRTATKPTGGLWDNGTWVDTHGNNNVQSCTFLKS